MPRALVFKGGALGDFLVTLPLLRGLRLAGFSVDLVGHASAATLAQVNGDLAGAFRADDPRWLPLFRDEPLPAALRTTLESYAVIIAFVPACDDTWRRHQESLEGPKVLEYSASPSAGPAAQHFAQPLKDLGLPNPQDWQGRLECFEYPHRQGIVLHPGSGSPRKNAPAQVWLDVARRLRSPVTVVGGEADEEALRPFHGSFELRDRLSLSELATLLGRASLFLGHDTGVSHLAAATGTPCRLIFGPTDPSIWAPPTALPTVLQVPELSKITADDVTRWLKKTTPQLKWV